jgi:geranylgeranylglycerol-phosphate geranylgeranyltransferase
LRTRDFLQLIRVHNTVGSAISDVMGYAVASHWNFEPFPLVVSALVVALVAAGGYVINDYYDVEIDRINKPYRPLPSGRVKLSTARNLAVILFIAGVALSFFLNWLAVLVAILASLALWEYARRLKRSGIPGNLVVATFSALSAFYGGIAYFSGNWVYYASIPTIYIFFFTLAREFVKGVEDYEGDKANNVRTLAVIGGVRKAWIVSKAILLALLITSPLPYFLAGFNSAYLVGISALDVILVLTLLLPHDIKSAEKARAWLKVYALGSIIVFLVGSSPFIRP